MNQHMQRAARRAAPISADRPARWIGRIFQLITACGLAAFGAYIVARASGTTVANFEQWRALLGAAPIPDAATWIASLGIGLHFVMGTILVLAWPILFSARIRSRHRAVHRWTGRVYVGAALLAGAGGLSFILGHGAYRPAASIAFAIWGLAMMLCAAKAYLHARARRFDLHRAWAIRLFALVLGAWLFDLEIRAWKDLAGGVGFGKGGATGPLDYAILYLFFVPNLLVAEFFIRNLHRRIVQPAWLRWPALATLAAAAAVFGYATWAVTAMPDGKFGRHLLSLVGG